MFGSCFRMVEIIAVSVFVVEYLYSAKTNAKERRQVLQVFSVVFM